jgi:hypothetical protein
MALAPGDAQRRALPEIVQALMEKSPAQALALVNKLPVGPNSDPSFSEYAQRAVATNQTEALNAISKISDADRAARTVREIAGNMARKDLAAAQQFVAASPIADESKAQLAQQIAQPRGERGGDFRQRGPGGPGGFIGGRRGGGN